MAGRELAGSATGMSESEPEQTSGVAGWGDEALDTSQNANPRLACATNVPVERNSGFREGRRFAKAQYYNDSHR